MTVVSYRVNNTPSVKLDISAEHLEAREKTCGKHSQKIDKGRSIQGLCTCDLACTSFPLSLGALGGTRTGVAWCSSTGPLIQNMKEVPIIAEQRSCGSAAVLTNTIHECFAMHGCFAMESELLYANQNGALFPILAII